MTQAPCGKTYEKTEVSYAFPRQKIITLPMIPTIFGFYCIFHILHD